MLAAYILSLFGGTISKKYIGDAARYLRATPDNIAQRNNIRNQGFEFLNKIIAGDYNKVVIAGHSLGSVIAYDLINFLWVAHNKDIPVPKAENQDQNLIDQLFLFNENSQLNQSKFGQFQEIQNKLRQKINDIENFGQLQILFLWVVH